MKIKHIQIPLYPYDIVFIYTSQEELQEKNAYSKINKKLTKQKLHNSVFTRLIEVSENCYGSTIDTTRCETVIWLDSTQPSLDTLGTLVHELCHAIQFMQTQIGWKHTDENEPYAYLFQWLFVECAKAMGIDRMLKEKLEVSKEHTKSKNKKEIKNA